ncbi:hypothetical protein B296_00053771 [Ensete ventricosum]|uniref:Uncharacterized protein n=1 Tax=Ensete ventricosum TaxID=4639 RepID=A0A426Y705_ENSVE|nr:hypothetical protein B296_00053771 [Ensete ventricosum]
MPTAAIGVFRDCRILGTFFSLPPSSWEQPPPSFHRSIHRAVFLQDCHLFIF